MDNHCYHCETEDFLREAACGHDDGALHCESHCIQCDICEEWVCTLLYDVKESEDSLMRCSNCREEMLNSFSPPPTFPDGDKEYRGNWE